MPAYNCDPIKMAKHYDRKTEQFDELITYAYSPSVTEKQGAYQLTRPILIIAILNINARGMMRIVIESI